MNTTIVIILTAVVIGGLFFFKGKVFNNSTTSIVSVDTVKRPYMVIEEAEKIVKKLKALGYYKYANHEDLDTLSKDMVLSLAEYGILSTIYNDRSFVPLDNRLFLFDGETLFEEGGFIDALTRMQPLFDKMNFRLEISNHVEVADQRGLNHRITLNGKSYIIFENFAGYGWGEAAQRFAEIINDQLELQKKDERLYLINGANDGTSIYLTDQQFNIIDSVLNDAYWKPLKVNRWCEIFQIDPSNYKSK